VRIRGLLLGLCFIASLRGSPIAYGQGANDQRLTPRSSLPEEQRLLLEAALNRLRKEAAKLDGQKPTESRSSENAGALQNETEKENEGNPEVDAEAERVAQFEKAVLQELHRQQASRKYVYSDDDLRLLEETLKSDPALSADLELFAATPFDIEFESEQNKNSTFVEIRNRIIDSLFSGKPEKILERHFIINRFRLDHPETLARFRHFEDALQLRYENQEKQLQYHQRQAEKLITGLGVLVFAGIGLKYFRTPVAANNAFPFVARLSRLGALAGLTATGYYLGSTTATSLAPSIAERIMKPAEPLTNDPLKIDGDLSEAILKQKRRQGL
jgi:hypothetical protein